MRAVQALGLVGVVSVTAALLTGPSSAQAAVRAEHNSASQASPLRLQSPHLDSAPSRPPAKAHLTAQGKARGKTPVRVAAKAPRKAPRPTPTPTAASASASPTAVAPVGLGQHVQYGAFAGGLSGSGTQVERLEQQLGARLSIASSFRGVGDVFPAGEQLQDAASGHTLLVSWYMGDTAGHRYSSYASGQHDAYLLQVAAAARDFQKPLYVRPWAEMNGDWTPFQPTAAGEKVAGGTPAEFIQAWRHVVGLFRGTGATNVRWVFNPTTDTYAETTDVRTLFPGTDVVDVLGLDGYNWGQGGPHTWRSFQDVYAAQYQRLVALAPGLPVWVCEFASKEPGKDDGAPADPAHSKADWYRDALASTAFPAVRALVFFDILKERDWRIASDPAAVPVVTGALRSASS